MKVFVVSRGMSYEGGSAKGVYSIREKAIEAALKEKTHSGLPWVLAETEYEKDFWLDQDCWFVSVKEFELDKCDA